MKIFSTLHFNGFLPVTQLSLAIDYFLWQNNPVGYHLTNLLLHLANVIFVYLLAIQLLNNKHAALITCLLFAIHPTRVESVAWAAERKDVLYAFFYLLSLFIYVKYLKSNFKIHFFILSFLFFTLSVFSKWNAFPLPFLLLLIDFYLGRKIGKKALVEKMIFLVIPFISIYVHFSKGTIVAEHFSFFNRIFLGCYSVVFYLVKFLFPVNLSAIYPYPKIADGFLPWEYYFSFFLVLLFIWAIYLIVKKFPPERNFILFCIIFFIINFGMVLHILSPIGGVVVAADRYTYIGFLGFFMLAGKYAEKIFEKYQENNGIKKIFTMLLFLLMAFYSFQTIQRIKKWKNSIVFFNDIIKRDSTIAFAWNNLGFAEAEAGKQNQAIINYSKAIELNPEFSFAYNNRGLAYDAIGNYKNAIDDFGRAISIKNYDPVLFYNRGLTFYHSSDYKNAINDFSAALKIFPFETKYYIKRGAAKNDLGDYSGAAEDFISATKLSPQNAEAYNYLGLSCNYQNQLEQALIAYDRAIFLSPGYSSAYNNRGWVKFSIKDLDGAMKDFSSSITLDSLYSFPYHNRGLLYYELNLQEKACEDWESAAKLGYGNSQKLIDQYCN